MTVPGTFKERPVLRRDLSPEGVSAEAILRDAGAIHAERWLVGFPRYWKDGTANPCTVMVAREPYGAEYRWHLSIAHPSRYPTWDEIKTAAYGIEVLQGVTLAQVFTPGDGSAWVNVHDNCFHLYEIHDEAMERMAEAA